MVWGENVRRKERRRKMVFIIYHIYPYDTWSIRIIIEFLGKLVWCLFEWKEWIVDQCRIRVVLFIINIVILFRYASRFPHCLDSWMWLRIYSQLCNDACYPKRSPRNSSSSSSDQLQRHSANLSQVLISIPPFCWVYAALQASTRRWWAKGRQTS